MRTIHQNKVYGNGILTQFASRPAASGAAPTAPHHTSQILSNSNNSQYTSQPSLVNLNESQTQQPQPLAPAAFQPMAAPLQPLLPEPGQPPSFSTSTPELNNLPFSLTNSQPTQEQIVAELQRLNIYKPPPPYPGSRYESRKARHLGLS